MPPTRRSILGAAGPAIASAAGWAVPPALAADPPDSGASDGVVAELVSRASQAHVALMKGDVKGYRSQIRPGADFTLMAPFGGPPTRPVGLSDERWESIARFFRNGRDSSLELIQAYRSADLVVLAAIERTHAEVGGLPGQPWSLRVTLVFRREGEEWLLAHRHADPLAEGISLQQAAALAQGRSAS